MQRSILPGSLVVLVALSLPGALQAQTEVFIKGKLKPVSGTVLEDTVMGIRLKGLDLIPAEQIDDVFPNLDTMALQIDYRSALKSEKDALKIAVTEDRIKALGDAAKKWEATLPKTAATQFAARRHVEFKVAYLSALQAQEKGEGVGLTLAAGRLKKFIKDHANCWQYARVMLQLASIQAAQNDFDAAEQTFKAIADNPKLSEGTKHDAAFQVVRMSMQAKKWDDAQKKLKDLAASLPKDSPYLIKTRLADAECFAALNNINGATDILKKLLKESKDRDVRAIAHNTLGYCYFQAKQLPEARWEFLWVDVVYNHNKAEHAKALYYLSHIFRDLKDADRAEECRQLLLSPAYNGLEFQRKAQAEEKGG